MWSATNIHSCSRADWQKRSNQSIVLLAPLTRPPIIHSHTHSKYEQGGTKDILWSKTDFWIDDKCSRRFQKSDWLTSKAYKTHLKASCTSISAQRVSHCFHSPPCRASEGEILVRCVRMRMWARNEVTRLRDCAHRCRAVQLYKAQVWRSSRRAARNIRLTLLQMHGDRGAEHTLEVCSDSHVQHALSKHDIKTMNRHY